MSKQSRDASKIRVWRSLVSRLNGVQEAAGSNPVTRTKTENRKVFGLFMQKVTADTVSDDLCDNLKYFPTVFFAEGLL